MLELHSHLAGAVPTPVLWEILCDSGLQTEFKSFNQLHRYLTVEPGDIKSLDDFLNRYFHVTELIQSSPHAASVAVYQAVAKAYRRADITGLELRYNPLKRIHGGRHTLSAIIMATIQGLQRASMHYGVHTGIIFSLGKELSHEDNWKIINAAVEFRSKEYLNGAHGVVGVDMAGPESFRLDCNDDWLEEVSKMFKYAHNAGLGVTWHVGETKYSGPIGIEKILEKIKPHRIGHGIELRKTEGLQRKRIFQILRERGVALEICPSVNLITRSIKNYTEIANLIRLLHQEEIMYCLNTDNPYLIHTNLQREYDLIAKELGNDASILEEAKKNAFRITFLKAVKQ